MSEGVTSKDATIETTAMDITTTWLTEDGFMTPTILSANSKSQTDLGIDAISTTTTWIEDTKPSIFSNENFTKNATTLTDSQSMDDPLDSLFEAFIIVEIVMTALELILSILAASKVARWRRNFRNQMLMQFSLVRFLKRVYNLIEFWYCDKESPDSGQSIVLTGVQFYIDFVIVFLVCFFIKHMYDSLIIVMIKINKNQLLKVMMCSWLLPLPASVTGAMLIYTKLVTDFRVYLFICAVFKWPLMFIGTVFYITILVRVLFDKIRQFARSLTIITFLLCLVLNLHLFCRDVIWLWCIETFSTNIASYILGLVVNILVLCLYVVLITLHLKCKKAQSGDMLNYSEYVTKC